jgi:HPt (histidine-containing phosphotransfer) domain-containing protein
MKGAYWPAVGAQRRLRFFEPAARVQSMPTSPVLDIEAALARLGGDQDLFAELAGFAVDDLPQLLENLRDAVAATESADVRSSAHALKGLVAGCGGVRASEVAQQIETAGEAGDIHHAAALIEPLRSELELLTRALQAYRARPG